MNLKAVSSAAANNVFGAVNKCVIMFQEEIERVSRRRRKERVTGRVERGRAKD